MLRLINSLFNEIHIKLYIVMTINKQNNNIEHIYKKKITKNQKKRNDNSVLVKSVEDLSKSLVEQGVKESGKANIYAQNIKQNEAIMQTFFNFIQQQLSSLNFQKEESYNIFSLSMQHLKANQIELAKLYKQKLSMYNNSVQSITDAIISLSSSLNQQVSACYSFGKASEQSMEFMHHILFALNQLLETVENNYPNSQQIEFISQQINRMQSYIDLAVNFHRTVTSSCEISQIIVQNANIVSQNAQDIANIVADLNSKAATKITESY